MSSPKDVNALKSFCGIKLIVGGKNKNLGHTFGGDMSPPNDGLIKKKEKTSRDATVIPEMLNERVEMLRVYTRC